MIHFVIAQRWQGVDPQRVLDEWDEATVDEAVAILEAENRYHDRHPEPTS